MHNRILSYLLLVAIPISYSTCNGHRTQIRWCVNSNIKNGELDTAEPVHAFWIRYSDNGQRLELNSLQRKFAYGIKSKALSAELYELQFVSNKQRMMYLKKGVDQKYYVYTMINQKQAILTRVFLKIDGGSFWSRKILYADFKGTDPVTGVVMNERVVMNK